MKAIPVLATLVLAGVAAGAPLSTDHLDTMKLNSERRAWQTTTTNTGLGSQWTNTMLGARLTNGYPVSAPQCFMLNACYGILLTDPLYNYVVGGYKPCTLTVNSPAPGAVTDPSFVDLLEAAASSQPMVNKKGKRLPAFAPATRYCYRLFVSFFGYV